MITQDLTRSIRALGLLTYEDAVEIGRLILGRIRREPGPDGPAATRNNPILQTRTRKKLALDLSACSDTTTPALAQLVVVRRDLLRSGCDLIITGLHGRARSIYEVNQLQTVLPTMPVSSADPEAGSSPAKSLQIA